MKTKHILACVLSLAMFGVISCSGDEAAFPTVTENPSTDPGTDPGTDTGTDTTDATVPEGTAVYFKLGVKWESAADTALFTDIAKDGSGGCEIAASSPLTNLNCTFKVPEGQLYRSKVQFKMGTKLAAACPILSFQPYYYRKSNKTKANDDPVTPVDESSDGYKPGGYANEELACADGEDPKCYGGAAPHLVEGFPKNVGNYILTHVTPQTTYELASENSLRSYYGLAVNYLVTNDLPDDGSRAVDEDDTSAGQERVGGEFVDYHISCKSYWEEPLFSITITIADENIPASGGFDQFPDWPGGIQ